MSEGSETPKKTGWGELGHKWITAIAALVTALASAGFFIGRSSAPEAKPSSPVTTTATPATVTVTAAPAARSSDAPTSNPGSAKLDDETYWSGELEWGKFNFDISPPNYTDGEYIQYLGDGLLYVNGNTKLTSWKRSGQPGKKECASAVDADGSNQTRVMKDNQVCGRSAEGRIFLLNVMSMGNTLRTQVTVWKK
ncbi:hypothetical protein [Amycolatopsis sp. NPDC054798]